MNLLIYLYFSPLNDHQAGGAQMTMRELIPRILESGIQVSVICPKNFDNNSIKLSSGVRILPILTEMTKRPLYPYEYHENLKNIYQLIEQVDVIWTLDRSFPLRTSKPVVLTLDNLTYGTEMESLWSFCWDVLTVPSDYLLRIVRTLVGQDSWDGKPPQIKRIPYGIDLDHFKPSCSNSIRFQLGIKKNQRCLVFPHRPDPDKGFDFALGIVAQLRHYDNSYVLLIPKPPLSIPSVRSREHRFFKALKDKVERLSLVDKVIFHDWISRSDLPAYYSLADWTLSSGRVPEGFGRTPVESISCGTPVISTMVGALSELFPSECGVNYVDFGNVDEAVSYIMNGIDQADIIKGQRIVRDHYSMQRTVASLLECFCSAQKSYPQYNPASKSCEQLSPWCHLIDKSTLWHDYEMKKIKLSPQEYKYICKLQGLPYEIVDNEVQVRKRLLYNGIILGSERT